MQFYVKTGWLYIFCNKNFNELKCQLMCIGLTLKNWAWRTYGPIWIWRIQNTISSRFQCSSISGVFSYFALINKGALPQALKSIFEVQRQRIDEKITRRKIRFLTYKKWVFFLLFEPLLFSKLITFLFFNHFKQFKVLVYRSVIWSSTNYVWTLIVIE